MVVSSVVPRVKEHNNGREFGAIFEVLDELKDYIKPSPLEISMEEIVVICRNLEMDSWFKSDGSLRFRVLKL